MRQAQRVCEPSDVSSSLSHSGQGNPDGLTRKVRSEEIALRVLHLRSYLVALSDKIFERDGN